MGTFRLPGSLVPEALSGYMDCSCRDCFEGPIIGVPGDICDGCEEAGCPGGDTACLNPLAYGGESDPD